MITKEKAFWKLVLSYNCGNRSRDSDGGQSSSNASPITSQKSLSKEDMVIMFVLLSLDNGAQPAANKLNKDIHRSDEGVLELEHALDTCRTNSIGNSYCFDNSTTVICPLCWRFSLISSAIRSRWSSSINCPETK